MDSERERKEKILAAAEEKRKAIHRDLRELVEKHRCKISVDSDGTLSISINTNDTAVGNLLELTDRNWRFTIFDRADLLYSSCSESVEGKLSIEDRLDKLASSGVLEMDDILEVAFRVKMNGESLEEVLNELEDRARAKGINLDNEEKQSSGPQLEDIASLEDDELPEVPDYFEDLEDE